MITLHTNPTLLFILHRDARIDGVELEELLGTFNATLDNDKFLFNTVDDYSSFTYLYSGYT